MSVSSLKTLRDAIKNKRFDGAYYIYGEDEFQKEDAVKQLVEAAIDPATRDFNFEVVRGGDVKAELLGSLISTPPMMADRRVVVVRDVDELRKDARKVLDSFLKKPDVDITVILVAGPGAKTDKGLQSNATPLEFDKLSEERIPRWIAHHASTEFKMEIDPGAAELLQSAVGNDLHLLSAELDKLASYVSGRGTQGSKSKEAPAIDEEAVTAVVGVRRGETVSDLLDAVLSRDAYKATELVPHIISQPKTSAVTIVMALGVQMLALGWARAKLDDGLPRRRLESELFSLLKQSGSVYTGRSWGSAVSAWSRAVQDWDSKSIDAALGAILEADVALKETRVSSEEQLLLTLVLTLCAADEPKRSYRAA